MLLCIHCCLSRQARLRAGFMSIEQLVSFLGWCSVINIGFLTATSLLLILFRTQISHIHSRIMGVSESGLPRLYFQYLALYKIAISTFNLAPYIALKMIN
ncbi:DUF6868 family protein [Oceanimonas smirnovii]|uniref:DUF6868 family protein n=1 Tax=Oceanimonas smirnovii TaxID=264574 RepID=A0ABW7NXE8_9GAMM